MQHAVVLQGSSHTLTFDTSMNKTSENTQSQGVTTTKTVQVKLPLVVWKLNVG